MPYLRGTTLLNEDVAAGKDFFPRPHNERTRLEFRASMFNIFNRTQFGNPNLSVESAAFGRISSQANRPRQVQMSLRFNF